MQYDMKKIGAGTLLKIKWHGAPTRVLVNGELVKRDVATGDVIEVTVEQARHQLAERRTALMGRLDRQHLENIARACAGGDELSGLIQTEHLIEARFERQAAPFNQRLGFKHATAGQQFSDQLSIPQRRGF